MYKVCILTAGKGTRMRHISSDNKALLPLAGKPIIGHIIEGFPKSIEIVIALGYQAKLVKSTLLALYKRPFTFVEVDDQGKGPGYSLLCCEDELQCPFVYMACDTLVLRKIPKPNRNWIGVAPVIERLPYLTIRANRLVEQVYDKGDENATNLASIGLVGVRNYKPFWESLANPQKSIGGEHQDTSGLSALIPHKLYTEHFIWFDTGNERGYRNADRYFSKLVPR